MNRKILVTALAAVLAACAFSTTAFAQQTAGAQTSPTATDAGTAAAQPTKAKDAKAVPPIDSRMCIRDTGSHIPAKKGQCLPVAGNSYSQKDIQSTGAPNIGQALQMLDPSVTVRGH